MAYRGPLDWSKPPVLGIFPIFGKFWDFGQFWGIVRFRRGLKNRRLVDFQQCRSKRRTSEDVCEISHTLEGRALTLYSEWRSLAGADNFYIPSRWRWYSGLSCTSRCMKGTGVYDCVLFEREWLFLIWGRIRLSPCLQSNKISSNDVLLSYFSVFSSMRVTSHCIRGLGALEYRMLSRSLHGLDPAKHLFWAVKRLQVKYDLWESPSASWQTKRKKPLAFKKYTVVYSCTFHTVDVQGRQTWEPSPSAWYG